MNSLSQRSALSSKVIYKGLIWTFYPIWGFIIALAWRCEEPSKITTILVVWIVQIIAWLIIKRAKKAHIIHSETTWIVAFSVKLLVTLFIIQYLWIPGFEPVSHRIGPHGFDPSVYDWAGVNLAEHNLKPVFVRTINYVGVIYYIGLIYYIFGVSTFYVGLFNTIFSLLTFLSIAGILHVISRRTKPWQLMALGMFFPELVYYDAIPAKGVLATAFMFISIFLLYSIIYKKKKRLNYFLICLSLLGLLVVRAPIVAVVTAIGLYVAFLNFRRSKRLLIPLFVGIVAFTIISPVVIPMMGGGNFNPSSELLDISSKVQSAKDVAERHHIDTSDSIDKLFWPNSFIQAILFAPFRSIFFLVAPFPHLLLGDLTGIFSGSFDYAVLSWNFTKLSIWCIIIAMPCLFAALFQKKCRKNRLYFYIVIPFILVLILLANGRYRLHPRYRVMLDPILLAVALFGYRYGNPKRFILLTLLILLIGFVGYFSLKLIA